MQIKLPHKKINLFQRTTWKPKFHCKKKVRERKVLCTLRR